MKSPLLGISNLLKIYSYIGVFPARIGKNACTVSLDLWRYLPQVIVALLYTVLMCAMFKWSTSQDCLAPNLRWDYWKTLSNMGR